jgi:hypothetical protein
MILVQQDHGEHCTCSDCLSPMIKEIEGVNEQRRMMRRKCTALQLLKVIDARAMQLNHVWPPEVADAIRAWWDAGKPEL